MPLPQELVRAAARAPLYRSRMSAQTGAGGQLASWPPIDLESILRCQAESDDPFGGRRDPRRRARAILQVGDGLPLYWALGRQDMAGAAAALAHCWRQLGIGAGDRLAVYDYGTSPLALFASASYLPYLRAGAAEIIGCTPICNDGLPELASRALHLLKYVRPKAMFVNAEAMEALLAQAVRSSSHLDDLTCTIIVSADEQPVPRRQLARWTRRLGLPVRQLLRVDAALFFAAPCPVSDAHHASSAHYLAEVLSEEGRQPLTAGEAGLLTVTNLFVRTCPAIRYVTDLRAALAADPCACGADGIAIRCVE